MSVVAWTEISTDFDPEEETANFGTRHALEAQGNIYEVVTLSTIEPTDHVTTRPNICSHSERHLLLVVDSTLIIFSTDCQDAKTLVFSSVIDCISVSQCGNFVVCGSQNGKMDLLHLPTKKILTSLPLTTNSSGHRCFLSAALITNGESSEMYIVSSDKIFVFLNLDLEFLHSSIMKGDIDALKSAQSNLTKKEICLNRDILSAHIFTDLYNNLSIMLAHEDGVGTVLTDQEDTADIQDEISAEAFDGNKIRKMVSNRQRSRLFLLDESGRIHVLCVVTMTVVKRFDEVKVTDLVLLEEEDKSAMQLLLTVQEGSEQYIEMRTYQGFKLNYRLKVADFCYPLHAHFSQDPPMLIEGTADDVLQPDLITKLRIRGITEGVPEVRLERMLRRDKFDEAEKFAQTFGMDKDPVYKRKAAYLLERISPWNYTIAVEKKQDMFEDLKDCLGKVRDLEYVIECCSLAALPSIHMTRDLLIFARKLIGEVETDQELNDRHVLSISKTMHRLETYVITEGRVDESVEKWIEFSRLNMLSKLKQTLERSDSLTNALLYWIRHKPEIRPELSLEQLESILDCMPASLPIEEQLRWLRQFIPDVLQIQPDSLPLVASWACDRVRSLELERKDWPENGLSFATEVLSVMQFGGSEDFNQFVTILTLNQQRTDRTSALCKLVHLINLLKDLNELEKKFRIKVKLSEFMNEDKFTVAANILDWVLAPEEIPGLMDGFLTNFIKKHQLNLNQTLMNYIINLLHNTQYTWHWHVGAAPWEEKVAFLLPFITSIDEKSQVVLEAVKQAPVPWSTTVADICVIGAKLNHPSAVEIKEQRSLVSVKGILKKYDCKNFLTSGPEADRLLQYILLKGKEDGYRDALEMCQIMGSKSVLEVNKLYIDHLIGIELDAQLASKKISQIMNASEEEGINVCVHVVDRAWISFQLEIGKEIEEAFSQVLSSITTSYRGRRDSGFGECLTRGEIFLNAWRLKSEFGLKTRETDWTCQAGSIKDLAHNRKLLESYISSMLTSDEEAKVKVKPRSEDVSTARDYTAELNRILRICDLTGLTQEEGVGKYILQLNKRGWHKECLEVSQILLKSPLNPTLANILYSVVYNMECGKDGGGDVGDLPDTLSTLAAHAAVYSQDSAIIDCLELLNWQNLTSKIHTESHDQRAYTAARTKTLDVFDEWKFTSSFKDKGLPLESEDLLPFACEGLKTVLPLVEDPPLPYLPRSTACSVQVCDLNTTAIEEAIEGNGLDAIKVSNDLVSVASSLVTCLQTAGHAQLAFQALLRVESSLKCILLATDPNFQAMIEGKYSQVKSSLIFQLIQQILSEPRPDSKLCLGLLNLQDYKIALSSLAKLNAGFGQNYRKISNLSALCYQYCRLLSLVKQQEQFLELYVRSSWGRKSTQLEIPFKSAYLGDHKERLETLEKFVLHPQTNVDLLLQYSRAFKIELDNCLVLYSRALIRMMEPNVDQHGDVMVSENKDIKEKLEIAWSMFSTPESLFGHLVNEAGDISPYNYEGLGFLFQRIRKIKFPGKSSPEFLDKGSKLLGFLLQYRRVSPPQPEAEVDPWLKERGTSFPRIASRRLPLYNLLTLTNKEKCKLLEKEFSLLTYRSWVLISSSLGISVDNICMYTVTNTITTIIETNKRDGLNLDQWNITHNNKTTLEELMTCIGEMKDPQKATAVSSWIVNRLPRGADKVLASHGYLRMADVWNQMDASNKESKVGLNIAQKTKDQLETEQVLCQYNLAVKPYLDLVEQHQPLELICKLYEDPSILERNRVAAGEYADINQAVKEIARINRLNHAQLKYDLLDKWLPVSCSNPSNQTLADFTLDLNPGSSLESAEEDPDAVNLLRCIYLLQDGSTDGIWYLLKCAGLEDPMVSTVHKLRALKCLLSVSDEDKVMEHTGKSFKELTVNLKNLLFISRMEKLNMPFNGDSFMNCNKENLVEGIWRTCKHSTEGIILVRDLCAEFNVWNNSTCNAILTQMIKYAMMKELERTLVMISNHPKIWNSPQLINSWNTLLLSPFSTLLPPVSETDESRCRDILSLIHHCPTAMDLDLERIAEECLKADLGHLVVILMPYLTQERRDKIHERVLNQISQSELTAKLAGLQGRGFPLLTSSNNSTNQLGTSPAL